MPEHFLSGDELGVAEIAALLDRADELRRQRGSEARSLDRRSIALLFEKPSTRTRISFEVGIAELGGIPVVLREGELQLSRGESLRDTALVLSRYLDAVVVRTGAHELLEELARYSEIPVINALTELHHPCQALADLQTLRQHLGDLSGRKLAYVGDGNNVAHSLITVAPKLGVNLALATPPGYEPDESVVQQARDRNEVEIEVVNDPEAAVAGADAIYTDVWVSMGDEGEAATRRRDLGPYQLNEELMAKAGSPIALHCLPAHPGEEITAAVLYGDSSAVWDQAENRLHTQKALLELLLGSSPGRGQ